MPNLRILIVSKILEVFNVTELMLSIVGLRGVIVFTLVAISVNGLVLQLLKALYFLGFCFSV